MAEYYSKPVKKLHLFSLSLYSSSVMCALLDLSCQYGVTHRFTLMEMGKNIRLNHSHQKSTNQVQTYDDNSRVFV